jgi:hypothetical protein
VAPSKWAHPASISTGPLRPLMWCSYQWTRHLSNSSEYLKKKKKEKKTYTKKEMKVWRSVSIITGVLNCAANASLPGWIISPLQPVWPFYFRFFHILAKGKSVVHSFFRAIFSFHCLLNGSCTRIMTRVSNCGSMWIMVARLPFREWEEFGSIPISISLLVVLFHSHR